MVDACNHKIRVTVIILEFQAEFHARCRSGVKICPLARALLRKVLVGELLHAKGNGAGHGALMELGSHNLDIPETGHNLGQDVQAARLVAVIVA